MRTALVAMLCACAVLVSACSETAPASLASDGTACRVADAEPREGERPDVAWLRAFYFDCVKEMAWRSDPDPWPHDAGEVRLTGPYIDKKGYGSHQRVRVWYSPAMAVWVEEADAAKRAGKEPPPIPVGSRMVKEMYLDEPQPPGIEEPIDGVAFMERTDGASFDSWLWALYFPPESPTTGRPIGFASVQQGASFCQTCHGVVADGNGTFAHLGNLNGKDVVSYTLLHEVLQDRLTPLAQELGPHGTLGHAITTESAGECIVNPAHLAGPILPCDRELDPAFDPDVPKMASVVYNDDVVPGRLNHTDWATSNACRYCHDTALLQAGRTPEMMIIRDEEPEGDEHRFYNLSPHGEASASLMARAVRDPVFLAQMEYERERYGAAGDKVSDFCLHCHGVMGQRAHADAKEGPFPEAILHTRPGDENAIYGSLARDGVSCNVCHRIQVPPEAELEEAYNANFQVVDKDQVLGPFESPQAFAMEKSIGVTPVHSPSMTKSELCISCHTVKPPVVPPARAAEDWDALPRSDEQMTYWEWANSDFAREQETCAGCHMPETFEDQPLPPFRIANIQTPEFPYSHAHAEPDEVELAPRFGYRRHTLTGINLFTQEMFRLLWYRLGIQFGQVGLPNSTFPNSELVSREAAKQARERTAHVEVIAEPRAGGLRVDVSVQSQVGHKFPSGVHFRRAWLEVRVEGDEGQLLWCSGCPDQDGFIEWFDGEASGRVPSENATHASELQKSWKIIDDPRKVAIYEEAYSQDDALVISFLGLEKREKDTKILPRGWRTDGPKAQETWPVICPEGSDACGVRADDPVAGGDQVLYDITLGEGLPAPQRVKVTLHYQPLPPHYLEALGTGGEHRTHLKSMVECLKAEKKYRLFEGWTVPVSCRATDLETGSQKDCLPPLPAPTPVSYYTDISEACLL